MSQQRDHALVLAVYFNTRGFVIFEGALSPVDWGVKDVRGIGRYEQMITRLRAIFDRYEPDILVIQDTSPEGTPRAQWIADLNDRLSALATQRSIPTFAYSRALVVDTFAYLGFVNKQIIASTVAKHIPAFERYLPSPRKPWMSEDSRMGLFDAAALALTFFHNVQGGEQPA